MHEGWSFTFIIVVTYGILIIVAPDRFMYINSIIFLIIYLDNLAQNQFFFNYSSLMCGGIVFCLCLFIFYSINQNPNRKWTNQRTDAVLTKSSDHRKWHKHFLFWLLCVITLYFNCQRSIAPTSILFC